MNVRFHFVVLLSVAVTSLGLMTGCGQEGQTGGDQGIYVGQGSKADNW